LSAEHSLLNLMRDDETCGLINSHVGLIGTISYGNSIIAVILCDNH